MLCPTRPIVKLGKSQKKLLTLCVLPSYSTKPRAGMRVKKNAFKTFGNGGANIVNCYKNKNIFGQTVNYKKILGNSINSFAVHHHLVDNLISFVKRAQVKKNYIIYNFIFNSTTNIAIRASAINRKYSTSTRCPPPRIGRHCYHDETENAINHQILTELNACYAYLSMACYFGRTEIALPGCYGYFMKMHDEEHEHALIFINYQLMRGGHVQLCPLAIPEKQNWGSIQKALAVAVEMEKLVKEKLTALYNIAEKHRDLHVMDLITTKFMEEQERSICEISRLFTRATHMGSSGVAEYLFDKEVHRAFVKKSHKNKDKEEDKENSSDLYI